MIESRPVPRPPRRASGTTLIEILLVVAILGLVIVIGFPPFVRTTSALRLQAAAQQVSGALRLARSHAIRHNSKVAVKFRTAENGTVTFALYRDGDGDGVRNGDIDRGIDPEVQAPRRLDVLNEDVRVGIPPGRPPRHPGQPTRRLDRLEDPIRFNRSDLASFSPVGTATPGTIYLTDRYFRLMAVRVFHLSGKISVLSYDAQKETWSRS